MQLNFILFCCVLLFSAVIAEKDNEVKRAQFPFMSFIYYMDETVVDRRGSRFLQAAVLIKPDWLVTASIEESLLVFPQKTLLARAGAITIDANITLNEDEDEQEREIIAIIIPSNHSSTQWWYTDISLLKTLMPFNMTPAISQIAMRTNQDYSEKPCNILAFVNKYGNWMDEKVLMKFSVDLISPPSKENCGINFVESTMACAQDIDEKIYLAFSQFCFGNKGGPLICDGELMGLQTYVDIDCKQPYLYQLLSAWENFISCGLKKECSEQCSNVCTAIYKDHSPSSLHTITFTDTPSDTTRQVASDSESPDEEQDTVAKDSNLVTLLHRTEAHISPNITDIPPTTYRTEETKIMFETKDDVVSSIVTQSPTNMDNNTESTTEYVDMRKKFASANDTIAQEEQGVESPMILPYKKGNLRAGTVALRYLLENLLFCIFTTTIVF